MNRRRTIILTFAVCCASASVAAAAEKPGEPGDEAVGAPVVVAHEPRFVAVGYALRRLTSVDGVRWQHEQAAPEKGQDKNFLLRGVAFGQGKIVAVGGSKTSRILTSDAEGRDWQDASIEQNWLGDVAYGNDRFVAVGYRRVLHSADGLTWSTPVRLPQASWRRIAFGNGRFVAVGAVGTTDTAPGFYASSTDGVDWTVTQAADELIPRSITYGNGQFVAVGSGGLRESSRDGIAWRHRTTGEPTETLTNVLWTGTEFVAWGSRSVYVSPDAAEWTAVSRRMPSQVAFGNGTFVGCSAGGFTYSTDGRTWQPATTAEKLSITKIIFTAQP